MGNKAGTIITLINAVTLNGTTTSYTSAAVTVDAWADFMLFLQVQSAGTPTTVQIIVQYSDDGGTTWYDYKNDFWGNLLYEDTGTASKVHQAVSGICPGTDFRVKIVGVGTDNVGNTFTVTAKAQFFNT